MRKEMDINLPKRFSGSDVCGARKTRKTLLSMSFRVITSEKCRVTKKVKDNGSEKVNF